MRWLKGQILNLKFSHKLMGVYLLVTAIPIIFVGVYLNVGMRNVMLNNAIFETESNLDKIEIRLDTVLSRITQISDLIYISRDMNLLLNQEYETTLDMYNAYSNYPVFDDFLKYYDEVETIQFYMTSPMITNSYFIHADEKISSQEWYQEAVNNRSKINWIIKEEQWTGKPYLTLTRSVYGERDQFLGVLAIYLSQEKLNEIVDSEIHDVFIVLDEERIIYNHNQELLFTYPDFLNGLPKNDLETQLYDYHYRGEDVTINLHRLQPKKSLINELQIATIIPIETLLEQPNAIFTRGYWIIFLALVISVFSFWLFSQVFDSRINVLKHAMTKVARGEFNIKPKIKGGDEIGEAYGELYQTSQSLQKLIDEVYVHKIKEERWRRQQKESEFKMLSSQINPHFLYNTLEMIRMKAIVNQDKEVATLIRKLSKMMRSALERTDRPVPLTDELDLINTYLEIQQMRFGDKLTYQINIDGDFSEYTIFPLIIQPLVENAIIHGLEPKMDLGEIIISVVPNHDQLKISVYDNGVGMTAHQLEELKKHLDLEEDFSGKQIGVRNVHQRIKLYYGDAYGLTISSQFNVGTTLMITLPLDQTNNY